MSEPILRVTDLVKRFPIKGGFFGRVVARVDAVSGVSFTVDKGETLGLVGESGCGKSTTARAVLRLHEPDSGSIIFDGRDVMALDKNELRKLRREMQVVFQDPYASLNPRWQINNIVGEPLAVQGTESKDRVERVAELLALVGLNPERITYFKEQGAPVDSFAVGSHISGATPIDFTGDIKEIDGRPIAKRGRIPGTTPSPRLKPVDLTLWRDGG